MLRKAQFRNIDEGTEQAGPEGFRQPAPPPTPPDAKPYTVRKLRTLEEAMAFMDEGGEGDGWVYDDQSDTYDVVSYNDAKTIKHVQRAHTAGLSLRATKALIGVSTKVQDSRPPDLTCATCSGPFFDW